jgi:hypothetical protein
MSSQRRLQDTKEGFRPVLQITIDLHSNRAGYFLDNAFPTAQDAKYKDSPSVNRTTYKEIGTWSFTVQQE